MSTGYEVIFCIVNAGYSPVVMDSARAEGAGGGTVLHARGTASKEAEKYFNITIQPEKEIVMILVPSAIKDNVLKALYRNVGLNTPGQGIAFSMSAESVTGISDNSATRQRRSGEKPSSAKKAEPQQPTTQEDENEERVWAKNVLYGDGRISDEMNKKRPRSQGDKGGKL